MIETEVRLFSLLKCAENKKTHTLGGVLIDMSGDRFSVDGIFGDSLLVNTHGSDGTQRTRVNFGAPIRNDAHNDLLPSILAPGFAPISFAQVGDILDDAMHGTSEELFIFVVHGENDEEFRPPRRVIKDLTQGESGVLEIIWVASGS